MIVVGGFLHPCADERETCPRLDGHYVPNRCREVYLVLRSLAARGEWIPYDRLVDDHLHHTRHERKLRELRKINEEYDRSGRVVWTLVMTRRPKGKAAEFMLNRDPRPQATLFDDLWTGGRAQPAAAPALATTEAQVDILSLLGI